MPSAIVAEAVEEDTAVVTVAHVATEIAVHAEKVAVAITTKTETSI